MSRFIGGVPPAGYTGSGPVKPSGPRGPIKPRPEPGKPAPSTGVRGRGPVSTQPVRPRGSQPGKPLPPKSGGRGPVSTQPVRGPVSTRPVRGSQPGKPAPSTKQIAALNKRIDADIMREKARALKFKEMIAKKKAAAKKK
jgi:hypothetical protein